MSSSSGRARGGLSRRGLLRGAGLTLLGSLVLPVAAEAAPFTLVAHTLAAPGLSGGATTTAINTTSATAIIVAVAWLQIAGGNVNLQDTYNNNWLLINSTAIGVQSYLSFYYCVSPTVGAGHTFSSLSPNSYSAICAQAWSGINAIDPIGATSSGRVNSGATAVQPGSVTSRPSNCLVISAYCSDSGQTSVTCPGFTLPDGFGGNPSFPISLGYLQQTSPAASNPTWTAGTAAGQTAAIAVFNPAPPATAAPHYTVSPTGDITSLGSPTIFDDYCGPDMGYYQTGSVCSGTAADSSHIVLAADTSASVVRHPITWNGVTCMCTAYNGATHVATVSGSGGYSANFGGVPQSGDAFTVLPIQPTITVGMPATGNQWKYTQFSGANQGCWALTALSTPAYYLRLTSGRNFDASKNIGDITSQPVPALVSDQSDHVSAIFLSTAYGRIDHLQIWVTYGQDPDGAFQWGGGAGGGIAPTNFTIENCLIRNDAYAAGNYDHQGLRQDGTATPHIVTFQTCKFVDTAWQQMAASKQVDLIDCDLCCTSSLILTATGNTLAGGTTITVASTAGFSTPGDTTPKYAFWAIHPSIPWLTTITPTNGTTFTIRDSNNTTNVATTGPIAIGDKIYVGPHTMVEWAFGATGTIKNCVFTGATVPLMGINGGLPTVTTCACDVPVTGTGSQTTQATGGSTGFTTVDGTILYNAGPGSTYTNQVTGPVGTPDLRLTSAGASALPTATGRDPVALDFFGRPWGASSPVGSQIFSTATANHSGLTLLGVGQ